MQQEGLVAILECVTERSLCLRLSRLVQARAGTKQQHGGAARAVGATLSISGNEDSTPLSVQAGRRDGRMQTRDTVSWSISCCW